MTSIHGDYAAANLIMIVLANGEGNKASTVDVQSLILIKPLDVVRVRVDYSL